MVLNAPDAAWIPLERWEFLTPEQPKRFLPLCPDFAIELMSETDTLGKFKKNARIYRQWFASRVANQPKTKIVEIYLRQNEVRRSPTTLSGEDVLPGFVLDLSQIFVP